MHDDALQRLEEKVLTAVARIKELRQENERLLARNAALEEENTSLRAEVDRTQAELDRLRSTAAQVEQMERKRQLIEEKVGGLLAKLEALE